MTVSATVITDASFYHDPRSPKSQTFGGWAAYIRIDGIPYPVAGHGSIKKPRGVRLDSTICEMFAAINGIWMAKQHGAELVLLQTDCMAVVHLIGKGGIVKPELQRLWNESMVEHDLSNIRLSVRHVKAHTVVKDARSWANDWCDSFARKGMRAARRGHPYLKIEDRANVYQI